MESLVIDIPFNALPVLKSARRAAVRPAQSFFPLRPATFPANHARYDISRLRQKNKKSPVIFNPIFPL
jgi:hypothetical protein